MPDAAWTHGNTLVDEILSRNFENEIHKVIDTMTDIDVAPLENCGRLELEVVRINTPSHQERVNDPMCTIITVSRVFIGNYVVCIKKQKV